MATFTPGFDFNKWSPDKSDLTRWYYDLAKYLKDHPIPGDDTLAKIISDYLDEHPIAGDFYGPDNQPPYPVISVNGQTGAVIIEAGGGPSDAYTPSNPPPYPVTSVNGKTGAVGIKAVDVVPTGSPDNNAYIWVDESIANPSVSVNVLSNNVNYTYDGDDLTIKFAGEIAQYDNPWAWMQARINSANFTGLFVKDYIPFTTTNGLTFKAQIAGIDTYYTYGSPEILHHIDFICEELWPVPVKFNIGNTNNGSSQDKPTPWIASNAYLFANSMTGQVPNNDTLPFEMVNVDYTQDGIYHYLPQALRAVIIDKRIYAPTRYNANNIVINDTGAAWVDLGKLWIPDEYEIMGTRMMSSSGWYSGGFVQYPIFAYKMTRVKHVVNATARNWWTTSSAVTNSSNTLVIVYGEGVYGDNFASTAINIPVCFRIGEGEG